MKKNSFVSSHLLLLCLWALSFLFIVPCAYARKVEKAEKPLSEIFKQLKRQKGATITPVNYTGTFGPNDAGVTGFTMQRRDGDGWTRGERVVIAHPLPSLVESVRREFEQLGQLNRDQCFLRIGSVGASAYFEKSRTFYCYEQAKDGTLYFLDVTTENEICVPVEWKTVDYYNQPAKNRSQASYFRRLPRSDQYVLALSRLWSGARRNFVFMNRVKLNWDSLYVAYLPLLKSAKSDDEATRLLQRMAATLRDGHTFVYSTSPTQKPVSAPLSTVLLEGKVYVDQVWNQDLLDRGVRRGMELVAIDGVDVMTWAAKHIMPNVSSSTPQWLNHCTFSSSELVKRPNGERVKLTLKDGQRNFTVKYRTNDKHNITRPQQPVMSYRQLSDGIGYLRINQFMDNQFNQRFDTIFAQLSNTKGLIIDVRNNPGGNSGYGDYIIKHLTTDTLKDQSWSSPYYIPAYASWGIKMDDYKHRSGTIAPTTTVKPYSGRIAVLVNAGTFSSAEDFSSVLQGNRRAVLVGEPTGGSTGNGVRICLQEGVSWANICSKHDVSPDGFEFVGHGLQPDIPVSETYNSYFTDGADAALQAARQWLTTAGK